MWVYPKYWNKDQFGGSLNQPGSGPMFWQDADGQLFDKPNGQPVQTTFYNRDTGQDESLFVNPEEKSRKAEDAVFERMPNPSNWDRIKGKSSIGNRDYADIQEIGEAGSGVMADLNELSAYNQSQMGSLGGAFGDALGRAIPLAVTGILGGAASGAFMPGATRAFDPGLFESSWGSQAAGALTPEEILASGATGAAPGSLADLSAEWDMGTGVGNIPTSIPSGSGEATSIVAGDPLQTPWTGAMPTTPGATNPAFGATGTGFSIDPATGKLILQAGPAALGLTGADSSGALGASDLANVLLSGAGMAYDYLGNPFYTAAKENVEGALERSSTPYTPFNPSTFNSQWQPYLDALAAPGIKNIRENTELQRIREGAGAANTGQDSTVMLNQRGSPTLTRSDVLRGRFDLDENRAISELMSGLTGKAWDTAVKENQFGAGYGLESGRGATSALSNAWMYDPGNPVTNAVSMYGQGGVLGQTGSNSAASNPFDMAAFIRGLSSTTPTGFESAWADQPTLPGADWSGLNPPGNTFYPGTDYLNTDYSWY